MEFFISDTHFGHKNIIRYCNRPFQSVEEMDEALIEKWNSKVGKLDTVYIIGDFAWNKGKVSYFAERLNGTKILVAGNHDETWTLKPEHHNFSCFEKVTNIMFETIDNHPVTMCHYPMVEWRNSRRESVSTASSMP